MIRFVKRLLIKKDSRGHVTSQCEVDSSSIPTVNEINEAEEYWIKSIQGESFIAEIRHLTTKKPVGRPVRINQFGLFLDQGVLKCRGRLNNSTLALSSKNPILLPHNDPFVKLLILQYHERVNHSGVNDTLTSLREIYWILKGKRAVKQSIKNCVKCLKCEGLPYSVSTTPDLPVERVSDDPPFTHLGIDFAGPLYIRAHNSLNENKAYICLFTCASTRVIHLELTLALTVDSFLLAFRRFVARRGLPSTIWSDNAKTFKAASKEIQRIVRSPEVAKYLSTNRVTWKFIVERAPWWGGFWERMVCSVKRCLRKTIGRSSLSHDELNTLLIEVESILNSRPLTYVFDDSEGISYTLSPSHLIYGHRIANIPNTGHYEVLSTSNSLTKRAKHHFSLLSNFTKQWRKQYLLSLREVHSSGRKSPSEKSVRVGDVVIIYDEFSRRVFWRLGIVTELLTGNDGITRAAIVKTAYSDHTRFFRRSIKHLIPIELNINIEELDSNNELDYADPVKANERSHSTDQVTTRRTAAAILGESRRRQNCN